jgi:hypothetical protein
VKYPKRTLIIGAFSFFDKCATFGDIQAMEVLVSWLVENKMEFDVLDNVSDETKIMTLDRVDPYKYDTIIYVCGPFGKNGYLKKFSHCFKIGLDISIQNDESSYIDKNECLDFIISRESPNENNPELAFKAKSDKVLVIGVALVHPQGEKNESAHEEVEKAIKKYFNKSKHASIILDTMINVSIAGNDIRRNKANIATISQLEALIRKCDVVISSRLHGLVYALKNNVPVVAIDPIVGGRKITAQSKEINWPVIIQGKGISWESISKGVERAMSKKDYITNIHKSIDIKIDKIKTRLIESITNYRNNT